MTKQNSMKSEEFYNNLKAQLDEHTVFPTKYLYKFIVPTKGIGVGEIETKFDNLGAVIETKVSSKGKYTAVSILVKMPSADSIISKYREMECVKGIMAL